MNLCEKIRKENVKIPESFDMSAKQLRDIHDNALDEFDALDLAFEFGYMQGQRAEKAKGSKAVDLCLGRLLAKLRLGDYRMILQLEAVLYAYLQKRGRLLTDDPVRGYDYKESIARIICDIENEEYLELIRRFAMKLATK